MIIVLASGHQKAACKGGEASIAHLKWSTRLPGRAPGARRDESTRFPTCWHRVPGSERTAEFLGWHYSSVIWGLRGERSPRFESSCRSLALYFIQEFTAKWSLKENSNLLSGACWDSPLIHRKSLSFWDRLVQDHADWVKVVAWALNHLLLTALTPEAWAWATSSPSP